MKIQMLGTGNAMATKCYNTCFVLDTKKEFILVDAGGGNEIFNRMEKTKYSFEELHYMILTHAHTDHILGAVWVVRKVAAMIIANKYKGEFRVYCHKETAETLRIFCERTLTKKMLACIDNQIFFETVAHREKRSIAGQDITFLDVYSSKMTQLGFMIEGYDMAADSDDKMIIKNEVEIKETINNIRKSERKRLVCLGDEPYNEKNREFVINADWLLCESFCLYADRERYKPYEKHHSTALDVGEVAESLGIKNLLLYHTEDDHLEHRKQLYTAEAKINFNGNVFIPDDMEIIDFSYT